MTDPKKLVKNSLFNPSVTGSTFEDFSNAVLLPAMEKPPPPVLNITPEQILQSTISAPQQHASPAVLTPVDSFIATSQTSSAPYIQQEPEDIQINQLQELHQFSGPKLSSVLSSFSNYLRIGGGGNQQEYHQAEPISVPAPAGLDNLISTDPGNAPPVPLFDPTVPLQQSSELSRQPPTSSGSANNFRRSGSKRPAYAQVPGLSTNSASVHSPLQLYPNSFPPPQPQAPSALYQPQVQQTATSPTNSTSSIQDVTFARNNQFTSSVSANNFHPSGSKRPAYAQVPGLSTNSASVPAPIQLNPNYFPPPQPQAPSALYQPPVQQTSISPASSTSSIQDVTFALNNQFKPINPQPLFFPPVKPNIPLPQHSTQLLNLGPVMDAIPASEALSSQQNAADSTPNAGLPTNNVQTSKIYRPVYHHWFHSKGKKEKRIWSPFSMIDSLALEHAFTSNDLNPDKVIATDGGRYDVNILRRQRTPVYWKEETSEVRRCSWFHKNTGDSRYVPYDENVATKLEEEFKIAFESNQWHRKVILANGETVEFHGPDVLVLFPPAQVTDAWTNNSSEQKPRVVKRGMDEFDIDEGESTHVDHLLFMVHGIGSVCDLKFRTVEEVVDEFRNIALQLTQSHYKSSCEQGITNRVEVLPISWHGQLHSEETGVDEQLKKITLESIPRLREFTNDTILDVLFYTSPLYCQTIISTVGDELNRVYDLFKQRNPSFNGGVSIGGHSLGSLILFDLLAHQHPDDSSPEDDLSQDIPNDDVGTNTPPDERKVCRRISYMMGTIGAGQPKISYPHLNFKPNTFFALGSPIGMFVTVRGLDKLGEHFCLPTCPTFFNIFHPYDPVAYRIEALVNPELADLKPVLIPHHKGRKRMHLELKETMARVGADLKQKVYDSMKSTWNSFYQLAMFHRSDQPALEAEVNQNIQTRLDTAPEEKLLEADPIPEPTGIPLGQLNKGRRIDYVLQEAPLEFFNEYIFALTSHVCYWESEDTILMILKEIYTSMNIQPDSQIPQQTMTIERPPPSPKVQRQSTPTGMNPTYPASSNTNLPPPPTMGFVRKT